MNKEQLDKVLAILSKHGVDDEVINEVENELNEKDENETPNDTPIGNETDEGKEKEPTPELDDTEDKGETDNKEVEPKTDEGVADEGENKLPEGINEVDLSKDAPVVDDAPIGKGDEPQPPLAPEGEQAPTDNTPLAIPDEKDAKIDELQKANEGLVKRIDALEDALRKGGILHDEKPTDDATSYGVDDPTHISDNRDDDELFDNVLAEINKRH